MQSQTTKIVLAVIITAIIVGSGVYYWQQQKYNQLPIVQDESINAETDDQDQDESQTEETADQSQDASVNKDPVVQDENILLADTKYGIKFTQTGNCDGYYAVKANEPGEFSAALIEYSIMVPKSTSWPADSGWYAYALYTPEEYNKFNPDELPGKPATVFTLDSGEILALWHGQDLPQDLPENCGVDVSLIE